MAAAHSRETPGSPNEKTHAMACMQTRAQCLGPVRSGFALWREAAGRSACGAAGGAQLAAMPRSADWKVRAQTGDAHRPACVL